MISLIPVIVIEANTEIVAPPSTQYGIVVSREENFGINPAASNIAAASPITTRLTTFVVDTIPTFWLYVAVGSPPKNAQKMLLIP